jgi:hypothetical protein
MANKSGIHINPKHKGEFTKKAKAAGMSVQAYAKHVHAHPDNFSAKTRQQAGFAKASVKFKHQAGGYQPAIDNTNPGMNPIQAIDPSNPTFDPMANLQPYGEPGGPQMPPQQGQQQQQQRYVPFNDKMNPYVKDFNEVASGVTAVGNLIQNGKQVRDERMQMLKNITPKYMQNMEGAGLHNGPAYTQYGGPGGMHGEGTTEGIDSFTSGPNFSQYSRGVESDVSDRRTEADVPVAGKPGKMPRRYEFGGDPSGIDAHKDWSEMDNEDYGYVGINHNGPYGKYSIYRNGGSVSSDKAKEILKDGTANGHPLTDKQRRYFGWIAGGSKAQAGGTPPAPQQQAPPPAQQQSSPEDYYRASATLSYYKDKLNDKLKAKNPSAFGNYFKGLQGARTSGQKQGQDYVQNSDYNDYLSPDEVKSTLGSDKDYNNYLNSLKQVNQYNVSQGQQPLYGNIEGQSNDPSQLNYGRRFASLQVTPSLAKTLTNSNGDKHYSRNYKYNPQTGQVDFTEAGDTSIRPEGFSAPGQQQTTAAPAPAPVATGDNSVTTRKYGGRRYQVGGSTNVTVGGTLGNPETLSVPTLTNLPNGVRFTPRYTNLRPGANAADSGAYQHGFDMGVGDRNFNYENMFPTLKNSHDPSDQYMYEGMMEALNPHQLTSQLYLPKDTPAPAKRQMGGTGYAIGDEIEMSAIQIAALKKQGYKFEDC